jgi:hypothetical protein
MLVGVADVSQDGQRVLGGGGADLEGLRGFGAVHGLLAQNAAPGWTGRWATLPRQSVSTAEIGNVRCVREPVLGPALSGRWPLPPAAAEAARGPMVSRAHEVSADGQEPAERGARPG